MICKRRITNRDLWAIAIVGTVIILALSFASKIDVQEFDQKQMNGAIRYQAREMLAERGE